jgi:hypothetical protein
MTSLWAQANLLKLYKVITAGITGLRSTNPRFSVNGSALRNIGVQ